MRRRILIVDDDEDFRTSLSDGLRWRGHDVHHAGGIAGAVALATQAMPEVVLVEIALSRPHGFLLARTLRRLLPNTLMMGVTSYARLAPEEQDGAGIACIFLKPVAVDEVAPLIESWTPRSRPTR